MVVENLRSLIDDLCWIKDRRRVLEGNCQSFTWRSQPAVAKNLFCGSKSPQLIWFLWPRRVVVCWKCGYFGWVVGGERVLLILVFLWFLMLFMYYRILGLIILFLLIFLFLDCFEKFFIFDNFFLLSIKYKFHKFCFFFI